MPECNVKFILQKYPVNHLNALWLIPKQQNTVENDNKFTVNIRQFFTVYGLRKISSKDPASQADKIDERQGSVNSIAKAN